MRRRIRDILLLTMISAALVGATPFADRIATLERTFRTADEYELLSLDPTYHADDHVASSRPSGMAPPSTTQPTTRARVFHDYRVLGSTIVKNPQSRQKLNDAMFKDATFDDAVATCFSPRHGFRLTNHDQQGNHVVDVVFCFQCHTLYVYEGGDPKIVDTAVRDVKEDDGRQPIFDGYLKNAGIELAPISE